MLTSHFHFRQDANMLRDDDARRAADARADDASSERLAATSPRPSPKMFIIYTRR